LKGWEAKTAHGQGLATIGQKVTSRKGRSLRKEERPKRTKGGVGTVPLSMPTQEIKTSERGTKNVKGRVLTHLLGKPKKKGEKAR